MDKKSKTKNKTVKPVEIDINDISRILSEEITSLQKRIKTGRIRDPKNEEIRIRNLRTLGYLCNIYKNLNESEKLESIERKMEDLQLAMEKNGNNNGSVSK